MIQLPGVNTTRFTWGCTKLPKQTMPVPPIYQPEVAADAIHYAAHHRRRQIYVRIPTVMNILGERMAPRLLDHYLAKTGYKSQLTDHDLDPHSTTTCSSPSTTTEDRTDRSTSRPPGSARSRSWRSGGAFSSPARGSRSPVRRRAFCGRERPL
jgi:hypothetical protein